MIHVAAKVLLGPLLHAQARRVRSRVPELPEPPGPRAGVAGAGDVVLRLLVAGDSSAAGVGAPTQDEALAAPLARALAARLGGAVHWQLVAERGLTSEGVLRKLMHGHVHRADVAVVVVGVNDITHEIALRRALRARSEIAALLRTRAGVKHVVFAATPDLDRFPALPQPLAWLGGRLSRRNNAAQARWAQTEAGVSHAAMDGVTQRALFAADGFHPAPPLYARVRDRLVAHIEGIVRTMSSSHATIGERR
jgi:lysophospholipase L1-like esterase